MADIAVAGLLRPYVGHVPRLGPLRRDTDDGKNVFGGVR
jgi:hypothetical protein